MEKRMEILNSFYGQFDEDARIDSSRQTQLEYLTTMHFIHKHAPAGGKLLEIGAGTGRYSVTLSKEGCDMTAVELVEHNLEILRSKGADLRSFQGDALDLSRFPDESFDMTLSLGPMYHLYDPGDVQTAIREAIRVTKTGGVLLFAFLSIHAIMGNNYLRATPDSDSARTSTSTTGSSTFRSSSSPATISVISKLCSIAIRLRT